MLSDSVPTCRIQKAGSRGRGAVAWAASRGHLPQPAHVDVPSVESPGPGTADAISRIGAPARCRQRLGQPPCDDNARWLSSHPMTVARPPSETLARLQAGGLHGCTHLDLRGAGLTRLPDAVVDLAPTLESLDVSGNALEALPDALACCTRLHTVFASGNRFTRLPTVLGRLPALDTLGFKANRLAEVAPDALAPSLRWLILTDNRIASLPDTLSDCSGLQKLMLAGNRLSRLPLGLHRLQRLELVRLSANAFEQAEAALPEALLGLPRLAWLAHAGNPFCAGLEQRAQRAPGRDIPWAELQVAELLGEGASGLIHAARWQPPDGEPLEVAVKLFKGAVTSDGLPHSEMAATCLAGRHEALVGVLGVLAGHPSGTPGLVMPRLGPGWLPLAGPPSMASCTRDIYRPGLHLPATRAAAIVRAATAALGHLHACGITHGDLYAHNLLVDGHGGALLSDFGAASFLPEGDGARADALRAIDRRALQVLIDEVAARCDAPQTVQAAGR